MQTQYASHLPNKKIKNGGNVPGTVEIEGI